MYQWKFYCNFTSFPIFCWCEAHKYLHKITNWKYEVFMHDKRVEVWEQNFKVSLRHLVIICHYCCHRPVIHCQRGMTLFVAVMKNDIELPFFKRNLRLKRTLAEWSSYCASGIKKKDSFSKVCFHSKICLIWLFIAKLLGKATRNCHYWVIHYSIEKLAVFVLQG